MTISRCKICGLDKEHTFKKSGEIQSRCKDCKSEYNKAYYKATKDKYNPARFERRKLQNQKIRNYIHALKDVPCMDCREKHPYYVMQFDHVTGEKKFNLANAATRCGSLKLVKEEAAKCDIVCANCHAYRTHNNK